MRPFDLLFLALFLCGTGVFIAAAVTVLRGLWRRGLSMLAWLSGCTAAYLGVVALASIATPQRYVAIGSDMCSDDWCIAVTGVARTPVADGTLYDVTFRVSSHARRVIQREKNVVAYLRDGTGHRYDADSIASGAPFDVVLSPGQAVTTVRRFTVPAAAGDLGVVVTREGGIPTPGCCVIGDEGSLLHKRAIVRLTAG